MNVASNIFYIITGIWGLYKVKNSYFMLPTILWQLFFITIMGVGIGSSYYHFSPATNTLFLGDRLPMSLGFAFLSTNFLAERYTAFKTRTTLLLIIGFSLYSVIH